MNLLVHQYWQIPKIVGKAAKTARAARAAGTLRETGYVEESVTAADVAEDLSKELKTASRGAEMADELTEVASKGQDVAKGEELKESAENIVSKGSRNSKPNQVHHYATNKSKTYTPQMEEITKKYGLNLDNVWNKDLLPHQGRHPNEYHEYILDSMKQFDDIAQGDKDIFLKLFDGLKENVKSNPEMLYKNYWK